MAPTPEQLDELEGRTVFDSLGMRMGAVDSVFAEEGGDDWIWIDVVAVDGTGPHSLVPLGDATFDRAGVHLTLSGDAVRAAPAGDPEQVDEAQLEQLHHYFERSRVAAISLPQPEADARSDRDDQVPPLQSEEMAVAPTEPRRPAPRRLRRRARRERG